MPYKYSIFDLQSTITNIIGFGTFLKWLTITKYIQYDEELNILPATVMKVGLPIAQQFVATGPIVIGLAFFAMAYFG